MKFTITNKVNVTFEFDSDNYVLVFNTVNQEYTLNALIDRSDKGKSPDIGCDIVHLDYEQAEELKKKGFREIQL